MSGGFGFIKCEFRPNLISGVSPKVTFEIPPGNLSGNLQQIKNIFISVEHTFIFSKDLFRYFHIKWF